MTVATGGYPVHGVITGPVVMIGFGSIGRGTLPLIERHFQFDKSRMVVIDPLADTHGLLDRHGIRHIREALTPANFRRILTPLLTEGDGQGFCVNLSVDTSSVDLMRLSRSLGVLYIDTVNEPWAGFYFDRNASLASRTNYALRERTLAERRLQPGGTTAVSCCGANPGMVSWLVKDALVRLAADLGANPDVPSDREGWARLMMQLGVKGIHIAERDTQRASRPKPVGAFWNSWSVEGFIAEGLQPAELGWGTHEKWMPTNAREQEEGSLAAIYLEQPGADTRVRSWCPTAGPQYGFLVTHNEAISISDYYSVREHGCLVYRPTCHYAYHPCNDAILSLHEMFGSGAPQPVQHVLEEDELADGIDELGVLLYGHGRNAYWYGSRLSLDEARKLAPYQSATGLQVSSAVIAGMAWALTNPSAGIVEADEMDHRYCLDIQRPYLGPVEGHYTSWTPVDGRPGLFAEDLDLSDPWQFRNILVR